MISDLNAGKVPAQTRTEHRPQIECGLFCNIAL